MYENFVGTWETVRNREVSVLERCPHGEVRLKTQTNHSGRERLKREIRNKKNQDGGKSESVGVVVSCNKVFLTCAGVWNKTKTLEIYSISMTF